MTLIALTAAAAAGIAGTVSAQPNERALDRLEVTLTLLPENAENAAQVIQRVIELPPPPATETEGKGGENSQRPGDLPGLEHGQGEGLETAAEARERGREFGQDVAADARENRESAGRSEDPPGPPEDPPGPPDSLPTPPSNPGRP